MRRVVRSRLGNSHSRGLGRRSWKGGRRLPRRNGGRLRSTGDPFCSHRIKGEASKGVTLEGSHKGGDRWELVDAVDIGVGKVEQRREPVVPPGVVHERSPFAEDGDLGFAAAVAHLHDGVEQGLGRVGAVPLEALPPAVGPGCFGVHELPIDLIEEAGHAVVVAYAFGVREHRSGVGEKTALAHSCNRNRERRPSGRVRVAVQGVPCDEASEVGHEQAATDDEIPLQP